MGSWRLALLGHCWGIAGAGDDGPGADMRSWAVDRMEGAPRGDSQGPGGTLGAPASTYWSQHEQSSFFGTFPHGFSQ